MNLNTGICFEKKFLHQIYKNNTEYILIGKISVQACHRMMLLNLWINNCRWICHAFNIFPLCEIEQKSRKHFTHSVSSESENDSLLNILLDIDRVKKKNNLSIAETMPFLHGTDFSFRLIQCRQRSLKRVPNHWVGLSTPPPPCFHMVKQLKLDSSYVAQTPDVKKYFF